MKEFREVLYSEILEKYAQVKEKTLNVAAEEKKFDSTQKHDNQEQHAEQNEIEPSR